MRYPMSGDIHFLECAGNTFLQGYMADPADLPIELLYGLISGAEWIGVLVKEAGVKPKGKWVIAEGADSSTHARSIPIEKLMDDEIIALYQNGERLRPAQGHPIRLFIPGWNVKWLRRLEVVDLLTHTTGSGVECFRKNPHCRGFLQWGEKLAQNRDSRAGIRQLID